MCVNERFQRRLGHVEARLDPVELLTDPADLVRGKIVLHVAEMDVSDTSRVRRKRPERITGVDPHGLDVVVVFTQRNFARSEYGFRVVRQHIRGPLVQARRLKVADPRGSIWCPYGAVAT